MGSGKQNGEAILFVAREGGALPLNDVDFYYFYNNRIKFFDIKPVDEAH